MSKIKIKNFGPIREGLVDNDGWIEIKKVTVFTGNQGSGKSTVAKLISTISWIEKALVRGDISWETFKEPNRFEEYCEYQNTHNYFRSNTEIHYIGSSVTFSYTMGEVILQENNQEKYHLPKIMYVPAERNFISAVQNIRSLAGLPGTLYTFADEYFKALQDYHIGALNLPINNAKLIYDKNKKIASIAGKDFEIALPYASSGFQSFVPLYLVTKFLSELVLVRNYNAHSLNSRLTLEQEVRLRSEIKTIRENPNLSENVKRIEIELISSKFEYSSYLNIVEEPEQNLYPTSQRDMLFSLLEFNKQPANNVLVMTTHSPYLINYLTLSVKAGMMLNNADKNLEEKINEIVPIRASIKPEDLVIYELEEKNGTISILSTYNGLPTDENRLNEELDEFNESYAQLVALQNRN